VLKVKDIRRHIAIAWSEYRLAEPAEPGPAGR